MGFLFPVISGVASGALTWLFIMAGVLLLFIGPRFLGGIFLIYGLVRLFKSFNCSK